MLSLDHLRWISFDEHYNTITIAGFKDGLNQTQDEFQFGGIRTIHYIKDKCSWCGEV